MIDFGMINSGKNMKRDNEIMVGMIMEREDEIESMKVMLKEENEKKFGKR